MKIRNLYIILIITLILLLLSIGSYYFIKKSDDLKFSARVIEAFSESAIIRPLDNDLLKKYDVILIDIPNLNKGDIIELKADKDVLETFPVKMKVISYNVLEMGSSTTKIEEEITTKSIENTTEVTSKITTIKVTTKEVEKITIEEYLNKEINEVETNKNNKSFKETAKENFIKVVDFIFYDKDINGVYFKDLSNEVKLKVIALALKLDNIIEKYYPNYKEGLSSSYLGAKGSLIKLYLEKTTEFCDKNDAVCKQGKEDFKELKKSLNITWDIIKSLTDAGVSKLRKWYEIYSGK